MTDDSTNRQSPAPDDGPGLAHQGAGLDTDVDGRSVRSWIAIGVVIAAVTLGVGVWWTYGLDRGPDMTAGAATTSMGDMTGDDMAMSSPEAPRIPPVFAYYRGEPIAFVHTEVSDVEIAGVLEGMMGSPVPVVASLADLPEAARGTVYVFTNGLTPADTPAGPLGFQPDVFTRVPGDDGYTPLVEIVEVTWTDPSQATLLASVDQITAAESDGAVTSNRSGVVVNAPLLTWPGGQR